MNLASTASTASAATEATRPGRLLELVGANWTTQAIGAAVSLGLLDALARQPCTVRSLAGRTVCDG